MLTTESKTRRASWLAGLTAVSLLGGGCAQDISPLPGPELANGELNTSSTTVIEGGDPTGGTIGVARSATIDASDYDLWVYLDLESGLFVNPTDSGSGARMNMEAPEDSLDWDLAFQRFKVKSNGGISGNGGVEGVRLDGVDFAALVKAPTSGYIVDAEDSDDVDTDPDYIFLGETPWYDYAGAPTHALSPADAVYVVRSVEGNYFKVQFTAYYDASGTSGFPAL